MGMNTLFQIPILEWVLRIHTRAVEKTLEGRIPVALGICACEHFSELAFLGEELKEAKQDCLCVEDVL